MSKPGPIRLVGDVHGRFAEFHRILDASPYPVLQVGDLGVGFGNPTGEEILLERDSWWFIRGNHDNPEVCRNMGAHLPGCYMAADRMFVMGGAKSIDRAERTEGLDWWPDEEEGYNELSHLLREWGMTQPEFVVTHEGPFWVVQAMFRYAAPFTSVTSRFLDLLLEIHRPKVWVFGHHHKSASLWSGGTHFRALAELECVDLVDGELREVER